MPAENGISHASTPSIAVALVQMNSGADKERNIAEALAGIDRAAASGARLVVLPEVWTYLGPESGNRDAAEPIPGPLGDSWPLVPGSTVFTCTSAACSSRSSASPGSSTLQWSTTPAVRKSLAIARSICSMSISTPTPRIASLLQSPLATRS